MRNGSWAKAPVNLEHLIENTCNKIMLKTSNNQRLWSAGNNDRRLKRFCSNAVLCISFAWQMVKTRMIRLQVIKGLNLCEKIVFCAFHS